MTTTTARPQAHETWEERQAREEVARQAEQKHLETLGAEIALRLPGKWYSEARHDFRPTLLMHDLSGMHFLLYISTQNRLTAHAPHLRTPRGFTPPNQPATITMANTRTAKSLAADIDRRLIDDLTRYFDAYRIMYHEEVKESTRHQNLTQALADAGEGTIQNEMDDKFKFIARGDLGKAVWTARESYQKERINLEFHQISTTHAQQILQFVTYLHNQRENEPSC